MTSAEATGGALITRRGPTVAFGVSNLATRFGDLARFLPA